MWANVNSKPSWVYLGCVSANCATFITAECSFTIQLRQTARKVLFFYFWSHTTLVRCEFWAVSLLPLRAFEAAGKQLWVLVLLLLFCLYFFLISFFPFFILFDFTRHYRRVFYWFFFFFWMLFQESHWQVCRFPEPVSMITSDNAGSTAVLDHRAVWQTLFHVCSQLLVHLLQEDF